MDVSPSLLSNRLIHSHVCAQRDLGFGTLKVILGSCQCRCCLGQALAHQRLVEVLHSHSLGNTDIGTVFLHNSEPTGNKEFVFAVRRMDCDHACVELCNGGDVVLHDAERAAGCWYNHQVDFGLLVQRSAWKHKRKVELLRYSSLGGKTATECGPAALDSGTRTHEARRRTTFVNRLTPNASHRPVPDSRRHPLDRERRHGTACWWRSDVAPAKML